MTYEQEMITTKMTYIQPFVQKDFLETEIWGLSFMSTEYFMSLCDRKLEGVWMKKSEN